MLDSGHVGVEAQNSRHICQTNNHCHAARIVEESLEATSAYPPDRSGSSVVATEIWLGSIIPLSAMLSLRLQQCDPSSNTTFLDLVLHCIVIREYVGARRGKCQASSVKFLIHLQDMTSLVAQSHFHSFATEASLYSFVALERC